MKFSLAFLLFLPQWCTAFKTIEDDLVFDDVGDESASTLTKSDSFVVQHEDHKLSNKNSPEFNKAELWDASQINVTVGHVFKLEIPKYTFGKNIERYEAYVEGSSKGFPSWIYWDESTNTLLGIPTKKDVGQYNVIIQYIDDNNNVIRDQFLVSVTMQNNNVEKFTRHKNKKNHCEDDQDAILSLILVDAKYDKIDLKSKIEMIDRLAEFLRLDTNSLSIYPLSREKHVTVIQWQVGCDGHYWKTQKNLKNQLTEQFKNGNLAKVLQLPVIRWQIKTDTSKGSALERNRRDAGSGDSINGQEDDDNEDYDDDYDDEYEEEDVNKEMTTETNINAQLPQVFKKYGVKLNTETESEHPHRHHHGEESIDLKQIEEIDEHDIVPILDHGAASGFNNSSTSTTITTTNATDTAINTSSLPTTTNTDTPSSSPPYYSSSSSSISSTMSTQPSSNGFETTKAMIMEPETTTTTTTTLLNLSTPFATSNTTVTGAETVSTFITGIPETSSILVSTPLPASVNSVYDLMDKVKPTEDETDTIAPIDSSENVTTSPLTTTMQPSTMDVITTVEKQQHKTTLFVLNVTSEEPTEESTVYSTSEVTTTPVTTVTFTTPVTNIAINTTVFDTTTQQTQKTSETSSSTQVPSTTTTTTSVKPAITISNSPPVLLKRIQKIPVFDGKTKTQIIPNETFYDDVDGYTRNLHLQLHPKLDWIEFNNETQEIYMIPLKKDISTHLFKLTATNSRGLSVSEEVQVSVQQQSKRVEFEFHLYLDILRHYAFPSDVDWKFKVIENLVELFGDRDSSFITLTDIFMENNHRAILSWTNDTLSTHSECPTEKIEQILKVLVDKDGNPSPRLKDIFLPAINVTSILNRPNDNSQCKDSLIKYAKSDFTTEKPTENYNPMLRNQIDLLNCTLGKLFVFKVPEDTFFDKKDGTTRKLDLSLRNTDGSEIAPDEWLQFDSKNQEFYGIPMKSDLKTKIYHLEARDKEGLTARDSLQVYVHVPKHKEYSVEFSMTLQISFEKFLKSAKGKRLFVEKVAELFGDNDTSAISLESITRGSTIVTWRNTSLPIKTCPNEEIERLRKIVVKEDKTLTDRVEVIMDGNVFPVKSMTVDPLGSCLGESTGIHKPDSVLPPFGDSRTVGTMNDDYLITFVLPAIIILTMLILAGIIACIFYKRRRSGKMSVSEQDDERQSFRNKGIPVIFQDELDEKPDPGNKSPIILKEEKPPLPPPEYQKSEDGADVPMLPKENSEEPYQPPPPFATNRDNNRQNRPKPTPTYRKPPPYVPP